MAEWSKYEEKQTMAEADTMMISDSETSAATNKRIKASTVANFVADQIVNKTLTESGKAADAKATGDALAEKADKTITDSGTGLKYEMGLKDGILTFTEVE